MFVPSLFYQPVQVQYGDIWQMGKHRVLCGDSTNAHDVERLLQGECYDLCFADPPYGIGIDEWDKALEDVVGFIDLVSQNLKNGGFFAFTHQMPFMVEWLHLLGGSKLRYKDQIIWVKRVATTPGAALMRSYENLFIYAHGRSSYYKTTGKYSDVKTPGILFDLCEIESLQRYICDLHLKTTDVKYTPRIRRTPNKYKGYQNTPLGKEFDRSAEYTNFTNVWSFLPENQRDRGAQMHTTVKPIMLMQRLLELCTPDGAFIYEPFLGSGTTIIAAQNMNGSRRVYGCEISPTYCETIIHRWQETTGQQAQRIDSNDNYEIKIG